MAFGQQGGMPQQMGQQFNPVQTYDQPSGGLWEWLFGSPERLQQIQNFNPQQQQALAQLLSQGLGGLGGLQNQYQQQMGQQQQLPEFGQIASNATRRFQQEIVPGIAERFNALGAGRSGALQGALYGAGANLASNLGAQESQFGLQRAQLGQQQQGLNLQNLGQQSNLFQNLAGLGLQPQFQNQFRPSQPGFLQNAYQQGGQNLMNLGKFAMLG